MTFNTPDVNGQIANFIYLTFLLHFISTCYITCFPFGDFFMHIFLDTGIVAWVGYCHWVHVRLHGWQMSSCPVTNHCLAEVGRVGDWKRMICSVLVYPAQLPKC